MTIILNSPKVTIKSDKRNLKQESKRPKDKGKIIHMADNQKG